MEQAKDYKQICFLLNFDGEVMQVRHIFDRSWVFYFAEGYCIFGCCSITPPTVHSIIGCLFLSSLKIYKIDAGKMMVR